MQLCATLTAGDLRSLVEQITPLRVAIGPRRVLTLGRPKQVELVAGAGLRIRGDARFTWDVGRLSIPVTLRSWQALLVPSLAKRRGHHVIAFDLTLEDLDFKRSPMFIDAGIAQMVTDALASQRSKLMWDFEKTLSVVEPFPSSVSPPREWKLGPTGGSITVTAKDVQLTLDFTVKIEREPLAVTTRPSRTVRA